ncbi:MAG: SRPBCC family protein [Crocinitomicaceae bacterium]|nr:SRPBCC family protein [Crocinitomicaceae bacterium]
MKKLNVNHSIEINTSSDKAWDIIGPNFINISVWARGINRSWENKNVSKKYTNAPTGGRFCEVPGLGDLDERIIHFDELKQEISWSAASKKLPAFVSGIQNPLKVENINDSTCRVSSNISANASGIGGLLLGGMMKKNFTKAIHGFMKYLKAYAETGEISDVKKRELAKATK